MEELVGLKLPELLALCTEKGIVPPAGASEADLRRLIKQYNHNQAIVKKYQRLAELLGIDGWEEAATAPQILNLVYNHLYNLFVKHGFVRPDGEGPSFMYSGKPAWVTRRADLKMVMIQYRLRRLTTNKLNIISAVAHGLAHVEPKAVQAIRTWDLEYEEP